MRAFDELLRESSNVHGHHCAGQVLGVRMAMVGCREVGIDEPKGCKKLIVYAEMDRCATDAVQAVTGCSLGKRTLKFLDYGKMAVTFLNTETGKASRVLARDDARSLVGRYAPDVTNPREAQKQAYAVMPEDALFSIKPVSVDIAEQDMPGFRGARVYCANCGEGINLRREVRLGGRTLCVPCARGGGPHPKGSGSSKLESVPNIVLIVGYKKVGKTTLIEKLIPELSSRGYRVGTIKHHHSDFPAEIDTAGTDTWRHRQAGAWGVALATPNDFALFRNSERSPSLDQLASALGEIDIVLVEGFHEEPRAKIEVLPDATKEPLCKTDRHLLAFVSPHPPEAPVPTFAPNSIKPLADLIEHKILARS
jgi:formylmethanofuran dehydrogenase subunit E